MGIQIHPWEVAVLGERKAHCKYRDFRLGAVQEWPNRSICYLDRGLGWAEGSTSSVVFARCRQCVHMGRHVGATWRMQLPPSICGGDAVLCQITLTTCYYSCQELLLVLLYHGQDSGRLSRPPRHLSNGA